MSLFFNKMQFEFQLCALRNINHESLTFRFYSSLSSSRSDFWARAPLVWSPVLPVGFCAPTRLGPCHRISADWFGRGPLAANSACRLTPRVYPPVDSALSQMVTSDPAIPETWRRTDFAHRWVVAWPTHPFHPKVDWLYRGECLCMEIQKINKIAVSWLQTGKENSTNYDDRLETGIPRIITR